jgi:glycosyltransferase involved in cell wall biosynthesis
MKISIIIPCYNGQGTLAQCLASVFALDEANDLEVIVVDDASRDSSARIAAEFPVKLVVLDRNGGASKARNEGVKTATGDIVFFTDADVVLPKDSLVRIRAALASGRTDSVVGVFSAENPFPDFFSQYKSLYCNYKYQSLTDGAPFNTAVAALPRKAVLELGGFNESLKAAEDSDFGERLCQQGYKNVVDHGFVVLHLKEFGAWSLLVNDYRKSKVIAEMYFRRLVAGRLARKSSFTDIGGSMMLNVPLCNLFVVLAAAIPFFPGPAGLASASVLAAILANNWGFLSFLAKRKGLGFAAASLVFTIIDYVSVGLAVMAASTALFKPAPVVIPKT